MERGVQPIVKKPCIAIAIVSGGPDSTCYMIKWLSRGCRVHVISFNYGQKASKELVIAKKMIETINE